MYFSAVFSFEPKPVDNIAFTLLVDVFGSHDFFELVNSDGASKEETVDFRVERSPGSPRFGFDLVVASFFWQPNECVTFNSVAAPTINRVYLKQDVRSALKVIVLGYELKVKREAKVTDKMRAL